DRLFAPLRRRVRGRELRPAVPPLWPLGGRPAVAGDSSRLDRARRRPESAGTRSGDAPALVRVVLRVLLLLAALRRLVVHTLPAARVSGAHRRSPPHGAGSPPSSAGAGSRRAAATPAGGRGRDPAPGGGGRRLGDPAARAS